MEGSKPAVRRRQWQPTPVLLPGKSHGQRSLVGQGLTAEAKGGKERESTVGMGSLCPERGDAEQKRNTTEVVFQED